MLDNPGKPTEALLAQAAGKSNQYDWAEASRLYQQILDKPDTTHGPVERAGITELLANARFKHAFQAEDREEFKRRMKLAEASYQSANALYEKAGQDGLQKRAMARGLFATFWLKDTAVDRRNIMGSMTSLAEEAAETLEQQGDTGGLAETHKDLLTYLFETWYLHEERKTLLAHFERALQIGEKAIAEFQALGEDEGLLDSLYETLWVLLLSDDVVDPPRHRELLRRAEVLVDKLTELSARTGTPYSLSRAKDVAAKVSSIAKGDHSKESSLYEEAMAVAQDTKDSLIIGRIATRVLGAAHNVWGEEDLERRRAMLEKGISFASTAIKNLRIPLDGAFLNLTFNWHADSYNYLATFVDTQAGEKREHARRAIKVAREAHLYEDYPWASDHALSKGMYFLSTMGVSPDEKAELLREALSVRERKIQEFDVLHPNSWFGGVQRNYLALIKAELANVNQDPPTKIELLRSAVEDMQLCVDRLAKWWSVDLAYPIDSSALAHYYDWYGDVLQRLYSLTKETGVAQRAIKIYEDAINHMTKAKLVGPVAPVRWKIARIHDALGDYRGAFGAFSKSAEEYRLAARKVSGLASVFGEIAPYMDAWSLIEQARLHHDEEHYLEAAQDYSKAASILRETRTRNHLSTHYMACSLLEKGEALSRDEKHEASVEALNDAVKVFREAATELEDKLKESPETQDKQELNEWLDITKGRETYSQARIQLEEARVLDKNGEEENSSTKYRTASKTFNSLLADAPTEQSRREMETLMLFCDAWANMKRAEVEASPQLYVEAASSFMKAQESTTRKRFRLLALANASMCKALETGTRFRRTRDIQLYSEIKKQLEAAADHYEQAAFKNAAEWTRATQAMFDALAYMASAEVELEPQKKTRFYHLAEKHLELASKLYKEAGFQSKSDEALRLLKRAHQEKEILLTPAEVFAENPAVTGAVVAPLSLTRDQALGLEKYEAANVVGNMSLHERELGVGSDLTLELEMANVGKTAAMLLKLENLAPEGLELDRQKIPHRVEDNYIDMKGKRLEYLKTHEVKVPMKATRKGTFEIHPRVLFVDEKGNYRSYDFEPVALTVRELGISGWLKGPK